MLPVGHAAQSAQSRNLHWPDTRHADYESGVGVQEARQRGDHHVEGVGGIAAAAGRVGQQLGGLQHLDEAARPSVRHDQRERRWRTRRDLAAQVDEVHAPPADLGEVVRVGVERSLRRAPIEPVRPIGYEVAQVAGIGPGRPELGVGGFREPGPGQARAQVAQDIIGYADLERLDCHRSFIREHKLMCVLLCVGTGHVLLASGTETSCARARRTRPPQPAAQQERAMGQDAGRVPARGPGSGSVECHGDGKLLHACPAVR